MQCPECVSTHILKNGYRRGKQNHVCAAYRRHFLQDNAASINFSR